MVARPDFFGDRAPAHQFALFEHQNFAAGPREVGGANQSIVAGADDDDVELFQVPIVTLCDSVAAV